MGNTPGGSDLSIMKESTSSASQAGIYRINTKPKRMTHQGSCNCMVNPMKSGPTVIITAVTCQRHCSLDDRHCSFDDRN